MFILKVKDYVNLDILKERYNFVDNGSMLEYDDLVNHIYIDKETRHVHIVDCDVNKIGLIIYDLTSKNILEKVRW